MLSLQPLLFCWWHVRASHRDLLLLLDSGFTSRRAAGKIHHHIIIASFPFICILRPLCIITITLITVRASPTEVLAAVHPTSISPVALSNWADRLEQPNHGQLLVGSPISALRFHGSAPSLFTASCHQKHHSISSSHGLPTL